MQREQLVLHRLGRVGIAGVKAEPQLGKLGQLAKGGDVAEDRREPGAHGFQRRQAEALVTRQADEIAGARDKFTQAGVVGVGAEGDAILQAYGENALR